MYRTQSAINLSVNPTPPPKKRSAISRTAWSSISSSYRADQPSDIKLPRGHLAYYRTIIPPKPCRAFRARVDREDQEGQESVVLAAAGTKAIYLWDLEDEKGVETIEVNPGAANTQELDLKVSLFTY